MLQEFSWRQGFIVQLPLNSPYITMVKKLRIKHACGSKRNIESLAKYQTKNDTAFGCNNRATEDNLGQRVIWDIFEHNSHFDQHKCCL